MAIYSLSTKPASRSSGKNAIAMAAYRCAGKILDYTTKETFDYSRKKGVIETELFFPEGIVFSRENLWNMAELTEKRKDARIAREVLIALPHELDEKSRSKLAHDFAKDIVNKYKVAVDMAIHEPNRNGDQRNFHVHYLMTTREISNEGLGNKTDLERSDTYLKNHNKLSGKAQIKEMRKNWEIICNHELERRGYDIRISAASYKERNIDKEPTIHLGKTASELERRGILTDRGNINREINNINMIPELVCELNTLNKTIYEIDMQIKEIENEKELVFVNDNPIFDDKILSAKELLENKRKDNFEKSGSSIITINKIIEPENKILIEDNSEEKSLSAQELLQRYRNVEKEALTPDKDNRSLSVRELLEKNRTRHISKGKEIDGIER